MSNYCGLIHPCHHPKAVILDILHVGSQALGPIPCFSWLVVHGCPIYNRTPDDLCIYLSGLGQAVAPGLCYQPYKGVDLCGHLHLDFVQVGSEPELSV